MEEVETGMYGQARPLQCGLATKKDGNITQKRCYCEKVFVKNIADQLFSVINI